MDPKTPTSTTRNGRLALLLPALSLLCALLIPASALPAEAPFPRDPADEILRQIGVDEKPGARIPPELAFTDTAGKTVRLGDFFGDGPVILTLNYYSCPMLCPTIFRNLVGTMAGMKGLSLANDFRIVTVSFDPREPLARARAKEAETHAMLRGIPEPGRRWTFLIGREPEIRRLTATVGYRYVKTDAVNYAHPAVIIVLTPDGRVARYLYGIEQSPRDLKLALIEASDGKIGGSPLMNRIILACYHYDPVGKKYALLASRVMTGAGIVTLIAVGIPLAIFWRRERHGGGGR
ncbi:SCO family protein [Geobacter sp.]|uniref:SCO family protein n=1 Tax=Geobacter sp. TaxID=46610 RepID=UPI002605F968|nr:SCO family protein [Geobacter sp.]